MPLFWLLETVRVAPLQQAKLCGFDTRFRDVQDSLHEAFKLGILRILATVNVPNGCPDLFTRHLVKRTKFQVVTI
jgi:hypothetical protein